jgi:hypothetical protein
MKSVVFKKTRWFTVITTLCLVTVTLFAAFGCDKTEIPHTVETPNISGMWKVKAINILGKLTNIDLPPDNASETDISITIPDTIQGIMEGHTFYNTIDIRFELAKQQQINIITYGYGGTRFAEDEWGYGFSRPYNLEKIILMNA